MSEGPKSFGPEGVTKGNAQSRRRHSRLRQHHHHRPHRNPYTPTSLTPRTRKDESHAIRA